MIRFFKKLFKRGDFMTRADKAYYKYRAKTIFWSAFCMIIIAWVGTNLVLCALTTNVVSNFDLIYEAAEPTVLPIGKEVNKNIADISAFEWKSEINTTEYRYRVTSVTFDKYNSDGKYMVGDVDVVETCNTSDKVVKLNDDITLYRMENEQIFNSYKGVDIYILSDKTIQANPDSSFMFYCLANCENYTFNNFDTSLVTNMMGMFAGDSRISWPSAASISQENSNKNFNIMASGGDPEYVNGVKHLDLSDWDTSNVTNMYGMFYFCGYLTSLNVQGWDTSNVTNMSYMFSINIHGVNITTLDLSSFNTSSVQAYANMFDAYGLKTVYVSDRWNLPESVLPSGCSYVQKEYTGK